VLPAVARDMLMGLGGLNLDGLVLVLGLLLAELGSNFMILAMLELLEFNGKQVMVMLLREHLLMMDRLDAGMVMGLMDLSIHGRVMTMMVVGGPGLMRHGGSDLLVHGSIMLAVTRKVLVNVCLSLIHGDRQNSGIACCGERNLEACQDRTLRRIERLEKMQLSSGTQGTIQDLWMRWYGGIGASHSSRCHRYE
jgi:hypothetical protein